MKVTDYVLVKSKDYDKFESSVCDYLNDGYQPHGVMVTNPNGMLCQVMVKYADDVKPPVEEPVDVSSKLYRMSLESLTMLRDLAKFIIDNDLQKQALRIGNLPDMVALTEEVQALHDKL